MKTNSKCSGLRVAVVLAFFLTGLFLANAANRESITGKQPVHEAAYLQIGGIEQWVTIDGDDISNPVVLFLHGGPGSTFMPFADKLFGAWANEFTLVHWDQRGAGRTYGRNAPDELTEEYILSHPLTIDQMANDGLELARHLKNRFGGRKIILFATSWGSILGVEMVRREPDLFLAYLAHSQIVHPTEDLPVCYRVLQTMAGNAGDEDFVNQLKKLGPPPYATAREYGQFIRVIKKYEALNSKSAPGSWMDWAEPYDNNTDQKNRFLGDDYSFIHYAGHKPMGIKPMLGEFNALEYGLEIKVPVFIVQGENDIMTSKETTKKFFDTLGSSKKEYFLVPEAAHDFNVDVVNQQFWILKEQVLPLINSQAAQ